MDHEILKEHINTLILLAHMPGHNVSRIVSEEKIIFISPGLPRLVLPAFQPVTVVSIGEIYTQGAKQTAISKRAVMIDN